MLCTGYGGLIDFGYLRGLDTIVIIGHVKADLDSMASGVLLRYCLKQKGIDSEYRLQDGHRDASFDILCKELGLDAEVGDCDFDRNRPIATVDFTQEFSNWVLCFDHHPPVCEPPENSVIDDTSSCTKLIHDWAVDEGIPIPDVFLRMTVYSCYSDTLSFLNTKSRRIDKDWCQRMIPMLGMDERRCIELGYDLTDTSLPIEDYVSYGLKEYVSGDLRFWASYALTDSDPDLEPMLEELRRDAHPKPRIFMISNLVAGRTWTAVAGEDWILTSEHPGALSRGKDVVPPAKRVLELVSGESCTNVSGGGRAEVVCDEPMIRDALEAALPASGNITVTIDGPVAAGDRTELGFCVIADGRHDFRLSIDGPQDRNRAEKAASLISATADVLLSRLQSQDVGQH